MRAAGGKSTLNRLELGRPEPSRYAKLAADAQAVEAPFVDLFPDAHAKAPQQITPDLDATDDPLHGHREGRFFHGYGACPRAGEAGPGGLLLLPAALCVPRPAPAGREAAALEPRRRRRIGRGDRAHRRPRPCPLAALRADSGFAREALIAWCEANRVDFRFGLARNPRLAAEIAAEASTPRAS